MRFKTVVFDERIQQYTHILPQYRAAHTKCPPPDTGSQVDSTSTRTTCTRVQVDSTSTSATCTRVQVDRVHKQQIKKTKTKKGENRTLLAVIVYLMPQNILWRKLVLCGEACTCFCLLDPRTTIVACMILITILYNNSSKGEAVESFLILIGFIFMHS